MASRKALSDQQIANLLEESSGDEDEFDGFYDSDDSDGEYEIQHREDSELEESDFEYVESNDQQEYYVARNENIKWNKSATRARRTPSRNIIRGDFGIPARDVNPTSIKDCLDLFITDEMKNKIILSTNDRGNIIHAEAWKNIDMKELEAYIGLLILAGVYKSHNEDVMELWSEVDGRPHFKATMSVKRFKDITRCMRFDDFRTRAERQRTDRMAAIREIFELFVDRCKNSYIPNSEITVDEQLYGWRGRVKKLKVYMPSKPAKYGLKFWILADAINFYCINIQLYLGKEGPTPEKRQGARVIFDLTSHLFGTGRNITCDNFFTDYKLAQDLLQKNITILGTVRKSRKEVPPQFLPHKTREIFTTLFGQSDNVVMLSYVPQKKKAVVLMSTSHQSFKVSKEEKKKPEMILDYNKTKGGVDTLDKLVGTYSTKRKINRWPMVIFFNILDLAAYNALVIWASLNPEWNREKKFKRRLFLKDLANTLIKPLIERRLQAPNLIKRKSLKRAIENVGIEVPIIATPSTSQGTFARKRCHLCPPAKDRKTQSICDECKQNVCGEHGKKKLICNNCWND